MTETNNPSPDKKSYLGIDADGFDRLSGKKIFESDSILPSFLESCDPNAGENISILKTRKWVAFFKLKKPTGFDFEIGNVYAADGNLYIYDKNDTIYQIKEGYMGITKEVLVQKYDYKEINI